MNPTVRPAAALAIIFGVIAIFFALEEGDLSSTVLGFACVAIGFAVLTSGRPS